LKVCMAVVLVRILVLEVLILVLVRGGSVLVNITGFISVFLNLCLKDAQIWWPS